MKIISLIITILFLTILLASCHKRSAEKENAVTFRSISMNDNHHLKDNVKNPILNIELNFQYPSGYSDDSVLSRIQKTMLADFLSDTEDTSSQPEAAMKSYMKEKINMYESSENLVKDEDTDENGNTSDVTWKDHTKLLIRCNTRGFLSYTIESSQFAGGAHGGITFRNSVIDLKNGDKMEEDDLFDEASLPLINNLILKKLELMNKVESPEELEQIGYFDVTQISQYKNFYLSDKGLVYTFNEGEIGAYALGTIEVPLTFQDLEGIISAGSPLEKLIR